MQFPSKNKLKARIIRHKSHRRCAICGKGGRLEIDHIVPKVRGGSNHILNLQFLCRSCNASKSSKLNWNIPRR